MIKYFLSQVFVFAFVLSQLEAGSWSAPVTLEGTWSVEPSIAVDSKGNAVAVWVHFEEELIWIKAATKQLGKSWSTPVTLSDAIERTNFPRMEPVVKFDQKDNAFVLWPAAIGGVTVVQGALLPKNADGWRIVNTPFSTQERYADRVHFAFDSPGSALIVCEVQKVGSSIIESARVQLNTMTWTPLTRIALPYFADDISMALDGAGIGYLLWSERRTEDSGDAPTAVVSATLPKNATKWSVPQIIHSAPVVWISDLVVDKKGNALCVWSGVDNKKTERSIGSALLLSGKATWKKMAIPGSSVAYDNWTTVCRLAQDPAGNAIALWGYEDLGIKSSRFSLQEMSWSTPQDVLTPSGEEHLHPYYTNLAFDPSGNAIFLWMTNEKNEDLHACLLPKGNTSLWSAPEVILADCDLSGRPSVAFTPDSRCLLTYWMHHPDVPSYAVQSIEGTNLFLPYKKNWK